MKNLINTFLFVSTMLILSAFSSSSPQSNWKLYKEINGVKIYSRVVYCSPQYTKVTNMYLIFKYENSTSEKVRISGRMEPYYNNNCRSCGLSSPNEYEFSIDIPAGESRTGNCSDTQPAFKIFYKSPNNDRTPLSKFVISNLSVTIIK